MDDKTIVVDSLIGFTVEADYHAYDITISGGTGFVFNYMSYLHDLIEHSYVITYNTPDTVHVVMDGSNLPEVIELADYQHKVTAVTATVGGPELYQEAIHQANESLVSMFFYSRTTPQSGNVDLSESTAIKVDIDQVGGLAVDPDAGVRTELRRVAQVFLAGVNPEFTDDENIPIRIVAVKEGLEVPTSVDSVNPALEIPVKPAPGASFPVNQLLGHETFKATVAVDNLPTEITVRPNSLDKWKVQTDGDVLNVTPDVNSVWNVNPIASAVWVVKQLTGLLGVFRVSPADNTPFPVSFPAGTAINANLQAQAVGSSIWLPVQARESNSQAILSISNELIAGVPTQQHGGRQDVVQYGLDALSAPRPISMASDYAGKIVQETAPLYIQQSNGTFSRPYADGTYTDPSGNQFSTIRSHLTGSEVRVNNATSDPVPVGIVI